MSVIDSIALFREVWRIRRLATVSRGTLANMSETDRAALLRTILGAGPSPPIPSVPEERPCVPITISIRQSTVHIHCQDPRPLSLEA